MTSPPFPTRRPRLRRALTSVVASIGVLAATLAAAGGASSGAAATATAAEPGDKIAPGLQRKFERSGGEPRDFWVSFEEMADTSGAAEIEDWAERGQYVVDRLRETAKESQADTIDLLDASGADYTAYWITNAIRINAGDYGMAQQLAAEPAVERVFAPVKYDQPDPIKQRLTGSRTGPNAEVQVEWGVENVKADQVWEQYGVRGDGIVVANIDTGVQFDHPALVNSYRGTNGDGTFSNDYNWFDVAGTGSSYPTDRQGHGTHTMGTMVGDDGAANRVGVAPGATWIAANGCCPTDQALIDSGQWMLAPTRVDGSDPDPAMRPHIINNSWGTELPTNDPFMPDLVQAWADAGIFGAWSNGNNGPGCETSGSPGSRTLNYSAGAHDSSNTIAGFSSRGPGQDGEVKPNISAPGVNVRSSFPGNQYAVGSGTSMAAPHLAGAVALLWSADPSLVGDIEATRQLLDDTATDTADDQCGGTADDNNVYGEGRLDALALVGTTDQGNLGTITGVVTHDESGDPVAGATIQLVAEPITRSTRTGDDGTYTANIPAGDYQATVSAFGYETKTVAISVTAGQATTTDIPLTAAPGFTVSGTVVDKRSGQGIPGTTVTVAGTRFGISTDASGEFSIENVPGPARYVFTIDPPGACSKTIRRSILVDGNITLPTLKLARYTDQPRGSQWGPPYGYSCVVEPTEWVGGDTPLQLPPPGDSSRIEVKLPFPFTYFGEQYETIHVAPNFGTASFDSSKPSAVLYVFDFPFARGLGEAILTRMTGAAPNRTFTVEWRDFFLAPALGGGPATKKVTVALTLHENGDIVYAYKDLDPNDPQELGGRANVLLTDHSPNGRAASRTGFTYSAWEPVLSDDRQIRFELPPNGFVVGHVVDKVTGGPVADASVDLYNQHGTRLVRKTTDADGSYRLQLMTGQPYSIGVVKTPAYETPPRSRIELTEDREVRRLTTTLHGGRIRLSNDSITLRPGKNGRIRLTNRGDRRLSWWTTMHEEGSAPPPGSEIDAVDIPAAVLSVAQADGTWWATARAETGGPASLIELDHGHPTGAEIDLGSVAQQLSWPSDLMLWPQVMTWLPDRGWLCLIPSNLFVQTIACVDPESSQVRAKVPTGYENGQVDTRGLTYDPVRDLFYVATAGYDPSLGLTYKTRVRTLDGLGHPEPGAVRHTCQAPVDSLGLSYNPTSRTLWTATLGKRGTVSGLPGFRQLEPQHCHVMTNLWADPPRRGNWYGDIDEDGNFLLPYPGIAGLLPSTVSTVQTSDPIGDDIPWLHVSTDAGTLDPRRSQRIEISVDWDAVPEGVTGAKLVFRGNGGANSRVTVPIRLAETRRGTPGPDWIVGTARPETILGLGAGDTLLGRGGDDRIVAARGGDTVRGGAGADTVYGGVGADRVTPAGGADTVYAGGGTDTVHLRRDGVRDTVWCGPGRDRVVYHTRRDHRDVLRGCERVVIRT